MHLKKMITYKDFDRVSNSLLNLCNEEEDSMCQAL